MAGRTAAKVEICPSKRSRAAATRVCRPETGVVEGVTGGEIIRAVGDQVIIGDQRRDILLGQRKLCRSTRTSGLTAAMVAAAESVLGRSTAAVM